MANEKDIKIAISTSADTSGLDKAESSIKRLTVSQADLRSEFGAVSQRFDASRTAYYDLDANIGKTTRATETFTAGSTKMQKPMRDNAAALLMFSQGFEDAQYGIRGVLNNIPGLVIALTGSQALAGAISIAVVAGSQLVTMFGGVKEKAGDAAEKIKAVAENAGALKTDQLEATFDAITSVIENADALKQRWQNTQTAQDAYATAAIADGAELITIQQTLATWLGKQRDLYKELEEIADRAAAKRAEDQRQALQAEQDKLTKAQDAAKTAAEIFAGTETQLAVTKADLVAQGAKLDLLRKQRDELIKQAALKPISFVSERDVSLSGPNQAEMQARLAGIAARQKLADPAFQANLAAQQEIVDALQSKIESASKTLPRLEQAFKVAEKNTADIQAAVDIATERISNTASKDEIQGKLENITATNEQFTADIRTAVDKITAGNAAGEAAKATVLQITEVGGITADETRALAEASRTLIGQLQGGVSTTNGNMMELINLSASFQTFQASAISQIAGMQAEATRLQLRLDTLEQRTP